MSFVPFFAPKTSATTAKQALGILGLIILGVLAPAAHGAGCDPVTEGTWGKIAAAAVYSGCTSTVSLVENTVAIKYNSGVIDTILADRLAFNPDAAVSTASIGTLNNYYAQDMGSSYTGDCRDSKGQLDATPTAIDGHYYCFRFDGRAADLYLGASYVSFGNGLTSGTASIVFPPTADDFITTWQTDNTGTSNSTSVTVPMVGGPYDVDWDDDGIFDETVASGAVTHDFGTAGTYKIRMRGTYDSIQFNNGGDKLKILSVNQWGTNAWTSMWAAFYGAANLTVPASDTPDFSNVTSMMTMFAGATLANPDTSSWDTSDVTDMRSMFAYTTMADPDTSSWDTSAVTNMFGMFAAAALADPDTSSWVTSLVTDMSLMFYQAVSADPDTSSWDTSAVINMAAMFEGATAANPNTSSWTTALVEDMSGMFEGATAANPDTSSWDTSLVEDMSNMFEGATLADPVTSSWNTSKVTDMSRMFFYAEAANPDTSGWNTAAVTDMSSMFLGATSADPDTSSWDTSLVENMEYMFSDATSANPDTSSWNTSAVTSMAGMFFNATAFDGDIGSWDVTALTEADVMFMGVTLSSANYESLLVGWDSQVLQLGVNFSGGNSTYCSQAAVDAKANMIASDSWGITDGGQYCPPDTCNVNMVPGGTEYGDITHEACEILTLGPDFIAASDGENSANVTANSGWEIEFLSGFTVDQGATLEANVCGQSLCMTSPDPMPAGCHSCVDQICAVSSYCCMVEFDSACLAMVDAVCGLTCVAP